MARLRRYWVGWAGVVWVMGGVSGCGRPPIEAAPDRGSAAQAASGLTSQVEGEAASASTLRPQPAEPAVVFDTAKGPITVRVAIADTDAKRAQGLMFVDQLADGRGMLFLMPDERVHSFWMKNTLIPLDMIFIASDETVAGVVARAEPLTSSPRRVERASRYVVEVRGGYAAEVGIVPGVRVHLPEGR